MENVLTYNLIANYETRFSIFLRVCMNKSILDSSKFRFSLDFSKFRFRIGDIVRWGLYDCEIVGYYFSEGFNNFNKNYGYVILGPDDEGHNGFVYGFDEYGNNLAPNPTNRG